MLSNKRILVIVDGPNKEEISAHLRSFKRFSICENNKNEIKMFFESEMWAHIAAILKIPVSIILVNICGTWIGVVVSTSIMLLIYCIIEPIYIKKVL